MKRHMRWLNIIYPRILGIFGLCIAYCTSVYAVEPLSPAETTPMSVEHGDWTFSGMVSDQDGERYAYFFQVTRHGEVFDYAVTLFNARTKSLLLKQYQQVTIHHPDALHWHIGRGFLQYNPINDTWLFGVKGENKTSFNMKVDMLKKHRFEVKQPLQQGVSFSVAQTCSVNGYVQVKPEKYSHFVTAKQSWYRRIIYAAQAQQPHRLMGLLCRFDDDSGFYMMNTRAPDAMQGATAGWLDPQGKSRPVSQFIDVLRAENGVWRIKMPTPKLALTFSESTACQGTITGFVADQSLAGFCVLQEDVAAVQDNG